MHTYFRAVSRNSQTYTFIETFNLFWNIYYTSIWHLLRSRSLEFRKLTANACIIVQFSCGGEDSLGKSTEYLLLTDQGHVIHNFQATEREPESGKFPLVSTSVVFKWHFRSGFCIQNSLLSSTERHCGAASQNTFPGMPFC